MASILSAGTTSATALNMSADTSGVLQLASNNGTVALTVTTAQYLGQGTSSPSTNNGLVSNLYNIAGTNNVVFNGTTTGGSYGLILEANQTGRSTTTRFAQIVLNQDGSSNGQVAIQTAPSGSDVSTTFQATGAGYILTPRQPALVAAVTSNKTIGSATALQFDTITLNRGSAIVASNSNSRFTVPVAGYYLVSFSWFLGAALNDYAVDISRNGTTQYRIGGNIGGVSGTAGNPGGGSAVVLSLAANDYIEIFGSGSKTILGTSPVHSALFITLIG